MANPTLLSAFERMWYHILAKLGTKADITHSHDDKYYTEAEIDYKMSGKADANHIHTIANITNLQANLDTKASIDHTHPVDTTLSSTSNNPIANSVVNTALNNKVPTNRTVNGKPLIEDITLTASDIGADVSGSATTALNSAKSYTDGKIDAIVGTGASETLDTIGEISAAIEDNQDMLETLNNAIGAKANASDLASHTGNTAIHMSTTEKSHLTTAYNHSQVPHAPADAEKNTLIGIQKNGTDVTINSTTRKANITVPTKVSELTNDKGYITAAESHTHSNKSVLDTITDEDLGLWDTVSNKVDKVDGKGLSTNDLTATLKSNYDKAYTHSTSAHAPANAEKNIIVGIQKNGTDITVDATTRKVNVTVPTKTSELTNDSGFKTTDNNTTYTLTKTGSTITLTGSDGSKNTVVDSNTTYGVVTTSANGLMSSTDKTKLDGIATGAEPNQNAFGNVLIGTTTISADTKTDTLTLAAGSNVTITPDATNDKITISAKDTTYADMKGATSTVVGTHGLVPAPSTSNVNQFLKGDGTWATPPNTTYGAAGTSLGLVKTGGDVTIASGVITVNDDSHNHVIANVDGLQSALDTKVQVSTTINGKALSTNITLSASDVDAYTKSEIDNYVLITVDDIDAICGTTIKTASEVYV